MPLDKAIESGKEKRKKYKGSKSFDRTCRNHGSCPYCEGNRKYTNEKRKQEAEDKLKAAQIAAAEGGREERIGNK